MKELSQQIYQFLHEHNELTIILPEEMDICRILSIHKFNIIDLVDMEVQLYIFSTSEWLAMSAYSASLCLSILMDSSTSSSKRVSSPDNWPNSKRQYLEEKSRPLLGLLKEESQQAQAIHRKKKKASQLK